MSIPEKIEQPDFSKLIQACEEYMKAVSENASLSQLRNCSHEIEDEALRAVYGDEGVSWTNTPLLR